MRGVVAFAAVLLFVLAGCAGSSDSTSSKADAAFAGVTGDVSESTGAIHGIVVDPAIQPIPGVLVSARSAGLNKTTTSDAQGRFAFANLQPGTYIVSLTHLLYRKASTTVEVKAGAEPATTKVQLEPVFLQKPFHDQHKFAGYIFCGYSAGLSSPCVFDYTQLVCPGGCDPTLHDILIHAQGDTRFWVTQVGPNWQTEVVEEVFDPPAAGVSKSMSLSYSFFKRTASDFMGSVRGASPLLLRLEVGEKGPGAAGTRPLINVTGNDDLYIFTNVAADSGGAAGFGLEQKVEVFETTFYNAKPPAGWSFVKGDKFPF